jgi:hypothetical protein
MKKLLLSAIACFVIVLSSCNQNSPTPSPATPATPTPTPTSSMTATEAGLVGDWIWDKTELYNSGNLYQTYTPSTQIDASGAVFTNTMYAGSHMDLKSSFYNGTANTSTLSPQFYNADYYSLQSSSNLWYVARPATGNQLKLQSSFMPFYCSGGNIILLNSTNLVIQDWLSSQIANGNKCYYHK